MVHHKLTPYQERGVTIYCVTADYEVIYMIPLVAYWSYLTDNGDLYFRSRESALEAVKRELPDAIHVGIKKILAENELRGQLHHEWVIAMRQLPESEGGWLKDG